MRNLPDFAKAPFVPRILALALMATTISVCYGLQYRVTGQQVFPYYLSFSALFVFGLVFLTYALSGEPSGRVRLSEFHSWVGLGLMTAAFTLTLFFQSKLLTPLPWYVLSAAVGSLAAFVHSRWRAKGSTRLFALAGLAFVVFAIVKTELWQKGDMLLLVEAAGREFLAGKQPYRAYPEVYTFLAEHQPFYVSDPENFATRWANGKSPILYLPGIWLAYLPAVARDIDPRVLNATFFALLIYLFEKVLPLGEHRFTVLSLAFYPVVLSPSFLSVLPALHILHYWLFLLLMVLCLARERYWIAAIFFGLALGTRQSALFVATPLLAYAFLHTNRRHLLLYGLAALGAYAVLTLPFAFWWGQDGIFWKHLYLSVTSLSEDIYFVSREIGVSAALSRAGLLWSASLIQIAVLVSATLWLIVRGKGNLSWSLQLFGVTYIWAVLFNPYAVRYEYYAGFLLYSAGLAMMLVQSSNSTEQQGTDRLHRSPGALPASA